MATPRTLSDIERAVRAAWGDDTCDPVDLDDWHAGNPSRGQCGVTALVLNDLLGGELVLGEVHADGGGSACTTGTGSARSRWT